MIEDNYRRFYSRSGLFKYSNNPELFQKHLDPEDIDEIEKYFALADAEDLDEDEKCKKIQARFDYEIIIFAVKFYIFLKSIGDIPDRFLRGRARTPHETAAFRVNDFLYLFEDISIRDNYVLDYVYFYWGDGGEPFVYAREKDSRPIEDSDEYREKFSSSESNSLLGEGDNDETSHPYLDHITFEKSKSGFFQFALFYMSIERFYRFAHSNYGDREFILTSKVLNKFIKEAVGRITLEEQEKLKTIDFRPKVEIDGDSAKVTILNYVLNSGYTFLNIYVKYPNVLVDYNDEVIIPNHGHTFY